MNHREPHPDLYGVPYSTEEFNGMPFRPLGRSGLRVPRVGLGTWKFGLPETGDGARTGEKAAGEIMDRAVELGVTLWDTANRYNNASGNSERVIGRWLRRNPDRRRDVIIATKVRGGMDGRTPNHGGLSRGNILDSVAACLERLETDRIDLLYFHNSDDAVPPEESLAAVEDLVRQGAVRYFGVSNFTAEQLERYQRLEADFGVRCRIVVLQNQFDILHGEGAKHAGAMAQAARTGVSFVAWAPLAGGLLSDRYLDPKKAGRGDRLFDEGILEKATAGQVLAKLRRLAEIARASGLELSQLALAYMLTLPGMGPAIPAASSVKQLESNAAVGKVQLSEEQRAAVAAALG
jgi:aryl-alcohol dehydrogenase-like predicted oxidoreductase